MVAPLETYAQHIGLLISYFITFSFWSAQTLALSLISRNVAGQTKKSVAIAFNFIIWATGNAIGKKTCICLLGFEIIDWLLPYHSKPLSS